MGGASGTSGGSNKGSSGSSNTGAPAWSSGSGGTYSPPWAGQNYTPPWSSNIGAGATNAYQGTGQQSAGAYGADPNADPNGYNAMNTQLQTAPMQSLVNLFQSGGQSPQTAQALQNLLGTSGSNNAMNQAGQMFQNLGQQGTQNFQNVYGAAGQPGANQQDLSSIASGQQMMNNPYINTIVNQASQDAMGNINQMFAAGGRYGSGMDQATVAQALAQTNNQFRGQEYENDANRQLTAANQIGNEQINRMQLQNQAAQGVGGLQTSAAQGLGQLGSNSMQDWINAQNAAGTLGTNATTNMLQGMGQLGNVQSNKLFDANQQLGVGNQTTQQTQTLLNNLANQWTQGDMSDWARTGALMGAGTQSAGNWGTTTGKQTDTSNAGIASIIGGILGMM